MELEPNKPNKRYDPQARPSAKTAEGGGRERGEEEAKAGREPWQLAVPTGNQFTGSSAKGKTVR